MIPDRITARLCLAFAALVPCMALEAGASEASRWRWEGVPRVIAFGDVHGDHDALVSLLRGIGVIDEAGAWNAGATHLVSLGDLLDRGPESRRVMELLMRLQEEAPNAGGRVHVLIGNHELMNLTGDLRYVAPEEYAAFAGPEDDALRAAALEQARSLELDPAVVEARPDGFFAHRQAFSARGRYGRWLLDQRSMIVIDERVFAHGGVSPVILDGDPARVEADIRDRMRSIMEIALEPDHLRPDMLDVDLLQLGAADPGQLQRLPAHQAALARRLAPFANAAALGPDGPFWYRGNAACHPLLERPVLERTLSGLGADAVVVGHTTQRDGRVHARLDGRVLLLDTGMLKRYYGGTPRAVSFEGEVVTVLSPAADQQTPDPEHASVDVGMAAAEMDALLADGEIVRVPDAENRVRVTLGGRSVEARILDLGANERKRAIAARRLDELMGLGMVPAVAERSLSGRAVLIEVDEGRWLSEAERSERGLGVPNYCHDGHPFDLVRVFDALIGHRRAANGISYRAGSMAIRLREQEDAFVRSSRVPELEAVPPSMVIALEALDDDLLSASLGEVLDRRRMTSLIDRRDALLQRIGGR